MRWILVRLLPWGLLGCLGTVWIIYIRSTPVVEPEVLETQQILFRIETRIREINYYLGQASSRIRLTLLDERIEQNTVLLTSSLQRFLERGQELRGNLQDIAEAIDDLLPQELNIVADDQLRQRFERQLPELFDIYDQFLLQLTTFSNLTVQENIDQFTLIIASRDLETSNVRVQQRLNFLLGILNGWHQMQHRIITNLSQPEEQQAVYQELAWWWLVLASMAAISFWLIFPLFKSRKTLASFIKRYNANIIETTDQDLTKMALQHMDEEIDKNRQKQDFLESRLSDEQQALQRAEQELALLKLYNETLVNNIRLGLLVIDEQNQLTFANQGAFDLLQVSPRDYGKPLDTLAWWKRCNPKTTLEQSMAQAIQDARISRVQALEVRIEASTYFVDVVISPYLDETNQVRGVLLVIEDVSEAIKMRHQLLETERLAGVGRLAAQVAHEVRNPLSSIGLNVDLLRDEIVEQAGDNQEAQELVTNIHKEIERLEEVTEGYLELARLPNAKLEPRDLNQVIQGVLSFLSEELRNQDVEVQLLLSSQSIIVTIDESQVRQALFNVIRNAYEAMPAGGSIQVKSQIQDDQAIITITDNGPGIDKDMHEKIFEPFVTSKHGGTGLGLSITRQLIAQNNGHVQCLESQNPGAVFEISFPYV